MPAATHSASSNTSCQQSRAVPATCDAHYHWHGAFIADIVCNRRHHIWLSKFNISDECNGNNAVMSIICIISCYILKISSYSTYRKSRSTFVREKNLSISTQSRFSKVRIRSKSSSGCVYLIPTRSQTGTMLLTVRNRLIPTILESKSVDISSNINQLPTLQIYIKYISNI